MTNAVHTRYTHIHTLVLSHNMWLRRDYTKVQVSEQAYHLTFPCGGFLYISQALSYEQKTKTLRGLHAVRVKTPHRDTV